MLVTLRGQRVIQPRLHKIFDFETPELYIPMLLYLPR